MNWAGSQSYGNRSKFKFPYLEDLKLQLRATNTYNIAVNIDQRLISNSNTLPYGTRNSYDLRILDKIDDWEKRNQLCFAIISMSVTSSILLKINNVINMLTDIVTTMASGFVVCVTQYPVKTSCPCPARSKVQQYRNYKSIFCPHMPLRGFFPCALYNYLAQHILKLRSHLVVYI